MPRYMVQFSYNTGAISDLVKNPQDRGAIVAQLLQGLGGKLESFDFAFGEYDGVAIAEAPDNVTMAALAMAIGAGGALKAFKTTVLISMEEAVEAMRKAGGIAYRPPGG